MKEKHKNISILCGTFSGNKGAASMLISVIKNLTLELNSNVVYDVLSVYPDEDRIQNWFKNVNVISCRPEEMVFRAFPLAILYKTLGWMPGFKRLLLKNRILRSFKKAEVVVDIAGVSFVDGRGIVMTIYNFICSYVPLAVNENVIKLSQATGSYNVTFNRFMAKSILTKLKYFCPRGKVTQQYLNELDIKKQKLCADVAFSLPDDNLCTKEAKEILEENSSVLSKPIISLSISSVVDNYCTKNNINYTNIMVKFIDWLIIEKNYNVLIIAQAAREGKNGTKNNDLLVCKEVYHKVVNKGNCLNLDKELRPETIREIIAVSDILVASRFHAMISALYKEVPVLLIGWSHKYKEVLDMFEIGDYAIDYNKLDLKDLIREFKRLEDEYQNVKKNIMLNLPNVKESSYNNFEIIRGIINDHELL